MVRLPRQWTLPAGSAPEQPPATPVVPRDAVTVVLLRDTAHGPELFLQRRVPGMPFAGGMTVFPGGGVDQRDADVAVAWSGPDPEWWGQRFDCTPEIARALVCAAVRETFEESGVLLAGPDANSMVEDTARFAEARALLVSGELSLAEFFTEHQLVLRADLLRPWANWVTPEVEPRRYDTRFFVAALPRGQRADGITTEAAHTYWRSPQEALDDAEQERSVFLPPTWVTIAEIANYPDVQSVLNAKRTLSKILPALVHRDGGWVIELPAERDV